MEDVYRSPYGKKRIKPGGSGAGRGLRGLYADLFRNYGLLPGEVSVQNPIILFKMLDMLDDERTQNETEITDENLRIFYGL